MSEAKAKVKTGFLLFPKIPFLVRVILIIALIATGLLMQLYYSLLLEGFFVILAGSIFGAMRSIKSKPEISLRGEPEWEDVTVEEWDRVKEITKKGNRWKSDITNAASGLGILMIVVLSIIAFAIFVIYVEEDDPLVFVFLGDFFALFGPVYFLGSLTTWKPPGLDVKLKALKNVYNHFKASGPKDYLLQPMMGFVTQVKDDKTTSIPKDARMMIRFEGAPEGFYGVQVQCSLNDVSGTKYPYLYAVILFVPDFPLEKYTVPSPEGKDLVYESSKTGEAIIMVIRQRTTKTSGYHTNENRQTEIVESAVNMAQTILQNSE